MAYPYDNLDDPKLDQTSADQSAMGTAPDQSMDAFPAQDSSQMTLGGRQDSMKDAANNDYAQAAMQQMMMNASSSANPFGTGTGKSGYGILDPTQGQPMGRGWTTPIAKALAGFNMGNTLAANQKAMMDKQTQIAALYNDPNLTPQQKAQIAMSAGDYKSASALMSQARFGQQQENQQRIGGQRQQMLDYRGKMLDLRDQALWKGIIKDANPDTASSSTPFGRASLATYQANRALKTLDQKDLTNAEMGNVLTDMASIYHGGTASDMGMKMQNYDTLLGKFAYWQQYFSANPSSAMSPEIKARLKQDLLDMQSTNKSAIRHNLDNLEAGNAEMISRHADAWKQFRQKAESDSSGDKQISRTGINKRTGKKVIEYTDGTREEV